MLLHRCQTVTKTMPTFRLSLFALCWHTLLMLGAGLLFCFGHSLANPAPSPPPANSPFHRFVLQLKWQHQFQFAGYYAAVQKGFYREAGLEVQLVEATPDTDVVKEVLAGHADFGISSTSLLPLRAQGHPVVAMAAIFQHSAQIFITRPVPSNDDRPAVFPNLHGKKVMIESHADELYAYLQREKIDIGTMTPVAHNFGIRAFTEDRVAAMSGYLTDEPFLLQQQGEPFQVFNPRHVGIDFYGEILFTTEDTIANYPKQVEAFRKASLKGWEYALNHPEEVIQWLQQRYQTQKSAAHLRFEHQKMQELIQPDLIEVGHMHRGRWQHIARTYADLNMLPAKFSLDGFLYHPPVKETLPTWLRYTIAGGVLCMVLGLFAVAYILRLNRELAGQIATSQHIEAARLRDQGRIHAANERLQGMMTHLPIALALVNADTQQFILLNPKFVATFGYQREQLQDMATFWAQCAPERSSYLQEYWQQQISNVIRHGGEIPPFEFHAQHPNGQQAILQCHMVQFDDWQLIAFVDLSEQKRLESRLQYMALHDELTGLANRTLLREQVEQAIHHAKRHQSMHFAVLFIDLDGFKAVNDEAGHAIGDEVLKEAAQRIKQSLRASDQPARLGGDEFAVILHDIQRPEDALTVAQHVLDVLKQPYPVGEREFDLSASIGIALYPDHATEVKALLHAADDAMYQVKRNGKNQCQLAQNRAQPSVSI